MYPVSVNWKFYTVLAREYKTQALPNLWTSAAEKSWKQFKLSWKSHGIVLSDFCGNPVLYGTNKNDINHNCAFGKTIYEPHLRRCSLTVVLRRVFNMDNQMLLSQVLWTIHIFSWAAGGQIPRCTMLLSLVWRVYEQNLSEWANGLHRPILRQWHWSGQCEVHRVRFSWPCHSGRSSDAFQRWYKRAGP